MTSEIAQEEKRMQQSGVTNTQEPPTTKSRNAILKEIREQLGPEAVQTTRLIDSLIAAWDTTDLLTQVFSAEQAKVYIQAGFEQGEIPDDDDE